MSETYKIIRFYRDRNNPQHRKVIKRGLTEEEAKKHCSSDSTARRDEDGKIVLQNATVSRSVSMLQSFFERHGKLLGFDSKKLWSFWKPEKLTETEEKELKDLKVGYRAKFLKRVSESFAKGEINEFELRKKDKEEQREKLLSLYGIGPASVGYLMVAVFHRWDYLDHISPWEQKIYTNLFFNKDYKKGVVPEEKMLEVFDEKWDKWKALAVHYIWQDLFHKRKNKDIPWLEELIRL